MNVEKWVFRLEGARHRVKHLPGQKSYGAHPGLFFGCGHDLVVRCRKNISLALGFLFGFEQRGTCSVAISGKSREPEPQRQRKIPRSHFHTRVPSKRVRTCTMQKV